MIFLFSAVEFNHLPYNRQLSDHECNEVERMIQMNGDKKLIQQQLIEKTGKKVHLKDIHNIATKSKLKCTKNYVENLKVSKQDEKQIPQKKIEKS